MNSVTTVLVLLQRVSVLASWDDEESPKGQKIVDAITLGATVVGGVIYTANKFNIPAGFLKAALNQINVSLSAETVTKLCSSAIAEAAGPEHQGIDAAGAVGAVAGLGVAKVPAALRAGSLAVRDHVETLGTSLVFDHVLGVVAIALVGVGDQVVKAATIDLDLTSARGRRLDRGRAQDFVLKENRS